mgnify:CR=1 FL=1
MLQELQEVLQERSDFTWDETVLDQLVKDSYSAAYGARNLRRHIRRAWRTPLPPKVIESYLHPDHRRFKGQAGREVEPIVIHAL